jgi:glycosyltransferase involved in cell wall biosynthesis
VNTPPPTAPGLDFLLVAPTLEYSASTLYALTLAGALLDRGYHVRVLTPGGRFAEVFRQRGVPLSVEPFLERFVIDWFLLRRLVRELRGRGVRVVHATSSLKVATATTIARRLGIPAVATVHRRADPKNPIEIDWTGVGAIITFSEDLRADAVNKRRAPKDLVRVIPAGVVAPAACRLPFDRAGAVPIVGTLGDVEKTEAVADFVRAARLVVERVPDVEFLVVSGGAEPRSLRHLARELEVTRKVTFTTSIDTRKTLAIMDICVLPGADEGPAQTMLEAMAVGRPIITTGAGGAYGVIRDEETGLIVEKGDKEKLAQAIVRVVGDRELARRLGSTAREVVLERFPLERMVDETLASYDAAVAAIAR